MNLLQAIGHAGDNWFRSVSFRKSGIAFAFASDGLLLKKNISPMLVRFTDYTTYFTKRDLTGEWEIVTPEQVMAERAK